MNAFYLLKSVSGRRALMLGVCVVLLATTKPARAAVLTTVPMQGTMVMPKLSYSAADGALHVIIPGTVPELIPLLVSNLGESFDPADPWYDALDPSRQGLAFSRRYGFVMNTTTDSLPEGAAIWIRKLSSSPGLSAYRSGASLWEPILGTAGSSNAFYWNGGMFHPAFTAAPGSNSYTASFEAYLLDTGTGAEVPGSSTGPFVFNWTGVPDGRPQLSIGRDLLVCWPAGATNWVLEASDTLNQGNWAVVTNTPIQFEGRCGVAIGNAAPARFFRMRLAP